MERVDWFFIITDLQRVGVYPEMVAGRLGVSRGTIQNFRNSDTEPRHCDGEALLDLWRTVTGKQEPPTKKKMTRN